MFENEIHFANQNIKVQGVKEISNSIQNDYQEYNKKMGQLISGSKETEKAKYAIREKAHTRKNIFKFITIIAIVLIILNSIIGMLGLSAEWEIITLDNAPFKYGMHFEQLSNGTTQFVDECTYKEDNTKGSDVENVETIPEESSEINELSNTYNTKFGEVNAITYPKFIFAYNSNWTVRA